MIQSRSCVVASNVAPVARILIKNQRGIILRIQSLAFVLLVFASTAQATNYVVSTTADSGAGSLRQAILDSNSPSGGVHTMTFSAAFPNNGVILLNSNLPQIVSQSLIVMGGSKQPRIDGQSLRTIFNLGTNTSTFELSDLTLQNALAPERGACINSGGSATTGALRTERVTFSNCQASGPSLIRGGAIYWNRSTGTVTLIDSRFLGNLVTATAVGGQSAGGAIYAIANFAATRTLFEANAALAPSGGGVGGAIALRGTAYYNTIVESTFRFNGASPASPSFGYGGAMHVDCENCTTQVTRSYLRGNSANFGGGIYARKNAGGTSDLILALANSTIYNSSVLNSGGAVFIGVGAALSASNNTFFNGDASAGSHLSFESGGQVIYFRANLLAPTYVGSACSGAPTVTNPSFVGFNLFSDASCSSLAAGALPNSPIGTVFVDERPGSIGVLRFSGSGVIDSISNDTICELFDARNQERPIDGDGNGTAECDVGAYEDPRDFIFINGFEA